MFSLSLLNAHWVHLFFSWLWWAFLWLYLWTLHLVNCLSVLFSAFTEALSCSFVWSIFLCLLICLTLCVYFYTLGISDTLPRLEWVPSVESSFEFWWCSCPWLPEPSVLRVSSVWLTWALLLWLGHDCCGYAASCQVGLAPGLACRKAQRQLVAAKASPLGLKLLWKGPRAACLTVQGRSYFGNHWCWLRWPARKDGA